MIWGASLLGSVRYLLVTTELEVMIARWRQQTKLANLNEEENKQIMTKEKVNSILRFFYTVIEGNRQVTLGSAQKRSSLRTIPKRLKTSLLKQ